MSWCIYMLRCRDGSLYTGCTNDLEHRIKMHSQGKGARYTKAHLPVVLVYSESCTDRSHALRREWELKQLTKEKKEALVAGKESV